MSEMESATSVPEIDEEELDRELVEASQAERTEDDAGQSEPEPQPEEGEKVKADKEPWTYDELRERYDRLNGALKEERGKRQELDRWRGQMEERLAQLQERSSPQERREDAAQKPDRTKDPLAYLDWLDDKVSQYEAREREAAEMQERTAREREQVQQIQNYGAQAEEEFRKQAPDYDDAAEHYAKSRLAELQTVYNLSEGQARNQLNQELMAAIVQSAQAGRNPAQAIYEAAKVRGYVRKVGEAESQLKQIEEGRRSSPTLPQGGQGKKNALSIDQLMKIEDPTEFQRAWAEAEKQGLFR